MAVSDLDAIGRRRRGGYRRRASSDRLLDAAWAALHAAPAGLTRAELQERAGVSETVARRLLRLSRARGWVALVGARNEPAGPFGVVSVPVYALTPEAPEAAPVLRRDAAGVWTADPA